MNEKEFREKNNVRQCEKCCGNCAHGRDLCDDGIVECVHPDLPESFYSERSFVCDAWNDGVETGGNHDATRTIGSAGNRGCRVLTFEEIIDALHGRLLSREQIDLVENLLGEMLHAHNISKE